LLTTAFDVVRSQSPTYSFFTCVTQPSQKLHASLYTSWKTEICVAIRIDAFDILNKQEERSSASLVVALKYSVLYIHKARLPSHLALHACNVLLRLHTSQIWQRSCRNSSATCPCCVTHCYPYLYQYNVHFFSWKYTLKIYCSLHWLTFSFVTYFSKRNPRNKNKKHGFMQIILEVHFPSEVSVSMLSLEGTIITV
jgi:hypothetical protein